MNDARPTHASTSSRYRSPRRCNPARCWTVSCSSAASPGRHGQPLAGAAGRIRRTRQVPPTPMPSMSIPSRTSSLIMKVPRIKGGEDPASIVGFEVEQMIMPALKGPHVPRFVARGDWRRQAYIVMERIEAESLRPRLDQAPLPLVEVVEIGIQVAHALTDLHRQHLVHLDIKPSKPAAPGRHRGAGRLRPVAARLPARPAGGGILPADGHRAVHVAGAGPVRPQRSAQRPLRVGGHAVPPFHRRAALRPADIGAAAAAPALRRPDPAPRDPARAAAVVPGDRPALPGGARRAPLPERRAARAGPAAAGRGALDRPRAQAAAQRHGATLQALVPGDGRGTARAGLGRRAGRAQPRDHGRRRRAGRRPPCSRNCARSCAA